MKSENKFLTIGAGPIGGILSTHLLRNGKNVIIVDIIKQRIEYFKEYGLEVMDPKNQMRGNFHVKGYKFFTSIKDIDEKPDYIFICTKAYSLEPVLKDLTEKFSDDIKIISFQNGLDNEEFIAEKIGKDRVMRVVVNFAGMFKEPNKFEITFFNKPNYIGVIDKGLKEEAEKIAEILTSSGLDTEYTDEIKKHEWEKAILNAALSPVCAVTGLTMREAMETSYLREIVEGIIKEGIEVASANGINFPDNFFEHCIKYLEKGGYHKPSMLVDVERGSKTEIDFLNAKIVEYGERKKMNIPYNKIITSLVKGIEKRLKKGEQK